MQVSISKRVIGIFVGLTLFLVFESSPSIAYDGYCCHKFDNAGRLSSRSCIGGSSYSSNYKDTAETKGWNCIVIKGSCEQECPAYPTGSPTMITIITEGANIHGLQQLNRE